MLGLVALQDLQKGTYIGRYEGDVISHEKRDSFMEGKSPKEVFEHESYDMTYPANEDYLFCPVDMDGRIKKKYEHCPVLYINEASAEGEFPNAIFTEFLSGGVAIDVVTTAQIRKGEEILTYYGSGGPRGYARSWPVWWQEKGFKMPNLKKKELEQVADQLTNETRRRIAKKEAKLHKAEMSLAERERALVLQQEALLEKEKALQAEKLMVKHEVKRRKIIDLTIQIVDLTDVIDLTV